MEKGHHIEKRVWALVEPVVAFSGYELIEVVYTREHGRWILRLYVDALEGVTLEDTTKVSRLLDPLLDVEDPIDHAYVLEVSSPGLDRPLRKPEHFERFSGETVRLRAHEPLDVGEEVMKRNFNGLLRGCAEGRVLIEESGRTYEVPLEGVKRAHIAYGHESAPASKPRRNENEHTGDEEDLARAGGGKSSEPCSGHGEGAQGSSRPRDFKERRR